MNINKEDAERLGEIVKEINERLDEFKHICRTSMSANEYQQFKYRTLGHIEPAVMKETEWITRYSSIDSLEQIAENASEDITVCKKCGSPIEDEYCTDETCPYNEHTQDEEITPA
jgi:hypothetical protein